jgi:hypothetical protein
MTEGGALAGRRRHPAADPDARPVAARALRSVRGMGRAPGVRGPFASRQIGSRRAHPDPRSPMCGRWREDADLFMELAASPASCQMVSTRGARARSPGRCCQRSPVGRDGRQCGLRSVTRATTSAVRPTTTTGDGSSPPASWPPESVPVGGGAGGAGAGGDGVSSKTTSTGVSRSVVVPSPS